MGLINILISSHVMEQAQSTKSLKVKALSSVTVKNIRAKFLGRGLSMSGVESEGRRERKELEQISSRKTVQGP